MRRYKSVCKQEDRVFKAFYCFETEISKLSNMLTEESGIDGLSFILNMQPVSGLLAHPIHDGDEYDDMLLIPYDTLKKALPLSNITDLPNGI